MNQIHNYIKLTALAPALFFLSATAHATITLTDTTNISLAEAATRSGNIFTSSDITGGLVTDLINYTPSDSNDWYTNPNNNVTFGGDLLFNGNAGPGGDNTGNNYAISGAASGTITLALTGGSQTVGSIAIYNGYGNRDDATYTLRDDSGTLGAWTIATPSTSVDSFWLVFDSPVTTANLFIDYSEATNFNSVSFAAIQPFTSVPEPATTATLFGLVVGTAAMLMRRRA